MDTTEEINKRRPVLAGLLSLILPGLGHVYAGTLVKGLLLIMATHIGMHVVGFLLDLTVPKYFFGFLLCLVALYLYALVSAFMLAKKNKRYKLKAFNRWYFYIAILVPVMLANYFITQHKSKIIGAQTYRIPSNSMYPTLQVGDYITVDTRNKEFNVGDVVVFPYPKNPAVEFVFRIAAVGGDVVSIKKGIVTRNGEMEEHRFSEEDQAILARQKNILDRVIPDGELLVLGDNRANSNDSRYWGYVKVSDVVGKVRYIYYAKDKSRIGTEIQKLEIIDNY